jgi:minor extracellular serine protease Vpr
MACDPNFADARVTAGLAAVSNAGHGTHVSGIIGAKAASPTGVTGVAPRVQFLAYKVFGCNGSVDNDIVMAALERAAADGAQVINMSLGADYQSWPEDPEAQLVETLTQRGIVVAVAEGNAGNATSGLFSNGTPAVAPDAIAVGSVDNASSFFNRFDVNGTLHPYVQAASAPEAPISGGGTLATVPDTIGCAVEAAHSFDGKIALIQRGTCSFYQKAIQAQNAGAIAVVIYNDVAAAVNPTVAPGAGNPP